MSKGEKSLWDLAIDHVQQKENEGEEHKGEEASVLVLGSRSAGKTSIILRFLDRDEIPKPTTALEYTFGRRAKGHNLAKDVGHIWELGGGTWLSRLIDIPINPDTIQHMAVAIVLDLSKPNELWFSMEKLLSALRSRIDSVISEARAEHPDIKDKLKQAAWERIGEDHPDKDMLEPFLIPCVIVGGKYDIFQEFDSEKRKVICKTLRFIAHTYGAHLQFFSVKHEALLNKARSLISHLVFHTSLGKTVQMEHSKPLIIAAGQDSLQQIGSPPLADGDIGNITARTPIDLWKQAYVTYFPQENISDPSAVEDPAKDVQYKEASIDSMRIQKDEELERYRRMAERRMRETQKKAVSVV